MFAPNLFAMTQTMAGPRAAGRWTAVQNGFGNLAGVAAPWVTGWVVQESGQVLLGIRGRGRDGDDSGAGLYVFGVGPIKQVDFRARATPVVTA